MTGLPDNWKQVRLGEVADWTSGGTPSSKNPSFYGGNIPWIVIGDLTESVVETTEKNITQKGLDSSSAKVLPEGTVMLAMYGASIGRTGIMGKAMSTNQAIACAIPKSEVISTKYLLYYLQSQKQQFIRSGKGGAQPNINQGMVKDWKVPIPPLNEQHKIVELVEDHLSSLDAAMEDVKEVESKIEQLRMSWLHEKFGIRAAAYGWAKFGEVSDTRLGKMLDSKKNQGMSTKYLGNINVRWNHIDTEDLKSVPLTPKNRENLLLEPGDLLICEGGEPGRCAIWKPENDEEVAYQKALHRARPKDGFVAEYLQLALEYMVKSGRANGKFTGTTIKHLPQEKLREIELPNMPLNAQLELCELSTEFTEATNALKLQAETMIKNARDLRRSLLQAAFTGQLTKELARV